MQKGVCKGLKIVSRMDDHALVQYVLVQSTDEVYDDQASGIYFQGGFALITTHPGGKVLSIYLGDGKKLQFGHISVESGTGKDVGACIDFTCKPAIIKSNGEASVTLSTGNTIVLNPENGFESTFDY